MTAIRRPYALDHRAPLALAGAAVGGLAVGVLTYHLQGLLPGAWNVLANSGAVWSLVAFGLAALCASRRWAAVLGGLLAMVGEIAGYDAIELPVHHVASSPAERVTWTLAAVAVGPVVGLAAHYWLRGAPVQRAVAAAVVCAPVLGEGLHHLRQDRSPVAGIVEVVVAVLLAAVTVGVTRAPLRGVARAVAAGLAVAAAVFVVYADPLLV